ncbi:TPA: hypothetical protein ACH3X1_000674 [Trebouxia sp. C0004]
MCGIPFACFVQPAMKHFLHCMRLTFDLPGMVLLFVVFFLFDHPASLPQWFILSYSISCRAYQLERSTTCKTQLTVCTGRHSSFHALAAPLGAVSKVATK